MRKALGALALALLLTLSAAARETRPLAILGHEPDSLLMAEDGSLVYTAVTPGATGSSPQAVILFGSGHANFSDAAVVPEGFAAHESFGDATGQVESVEQADPDTITVTWKGPDGELRAVDHRQQDGRIVVE